MVEVSIAMTILALALVPMLGVFIVSSEEARANKNRTVAAALAASVLERYRCVPPEQLKTLFPQKWEAIKAQVKTMMDSAGVMGPSVPVLLDADPILSPWAKGNLVGAGPTSGPQYGTEFSDFISKIGFRRFCAYDVAGDIDPSGRHAGTLTCAVVWFERAAAGTRGVSYQLSTVVVDPIFPFGKEP